MSYHGFGDDQDTPAQVHIAFGPSAAGPQMAPASSISPCAFVTQDLPWGVGKEAERISAETRRQNSVHRITDHGQPWLLIGSTSQSMGHLVNALRRLGVMASDEAPTLPEGGGHNRKISEASGVGAAAIRAWQRFGREPGWNIRDLTDNRDAGWTWDWGRFLRIHPDMWDRIRAADRGARQPWEGARDQRGFVYVVGGSYPRRDLLIDRVARRLMTAGYVDSGRVGSEVFTSSGGWLGGDSGQFVRGLHRVWQQAGANPAHWPSGFNFGPTDGSNLRVHPTVLQFINDNLIRGERIQMAKQLRVRVVGPIRGGFPKVQ